MVNTKKIAATAVIPEELFVVIWIQEKTTIGKYASSMKLIGE